MPPTTIEISAQFEGRDAAQAVLPHMHALKAAAKGISFTGFPFRELAFILRVDGEVNAFGESGPGHVKFDRKGQYVSVDIGITRDDWTGKAPSEVSARVALAITSTVDLLKGLKSPKLRSVDWAAFEDALRIFSISYKGQLGGG